MVYDADEQGDIIADTTAREAVYACDKAGLNPTGVVARLRLRSATRMEQSTDTFYSQLLTAIGANLRQPVRK